jgi:hypothetical protein
LISGLGGGGALTGGGCGEQNGFTDFVELMIKYKGDPNICGSGGDTPLCKAAQAGNSKVRCRLSTSQP